MLLNPDVLLLGSDLFPHVPFGTWIYHMKACMSYRVSNVHIPLYPLIQPDILLFPCLSPHPFSWNQMVGTSLVRICGWGHMFPFLIN